jgi:uncharacterized protein
MALGDRTEEVPYTEQEKELDRVMALWTGLRERDETPGPGKPPKVTASPWRVYGNRWVDESRDLVLLSGVGRKERELLHQAGITRVDRLWDLPQEQVVSILGRAAGENAYFIAQAYKTGGPILKPGLSYTMPRGRRHLYFDFETCDDVHPTEPPHVYLIGSWDAGRDQFAYFLSKGAGDEERIFLEFLEYVGEDPETRLYHWTDFEIKQMVQVARRWPALKDPFERFFTQCVDLKEAVKSMVYLPVPTYSIKSVAPAVGFHWRQKDVGAFESMVAYWDYVDGKDDAAVQKAVRYNEDDCIAMWHVDQELMRRLT